ADMAAEPSNIRHDARSFRLARTCDRGVQMGALVVSAALGLAEGLHEAEAFGLGELGEGGLLGLKAEPAPPLLGRRDPNVGHGIPHIFASRTRSNEHWYVYTDV